MDNADYKQIFKYMYFSFGSLKIQNIFFVALI